VIRSSPENRVAQLDAVIIEKLRIFNKSAGVAAIFNFVMSSFNLMILRVEG
jgi:hypothetical protein